MSETTATTRDSSDPSARPLGLGYLIAVRTATVAGVFSLLVCVLLLAEYGRRQVADPLESPEFLALKAKLAKSLNDEKIKEEIEKIKEEIRTLDLELREEYFQQRRFAEVGTWLLLGGVVVFLIAAKSASTLRRKLPMPEPQAAPQDTETPMTKVARWSVALLAVVFVLGAIALRLSVRDELAVLPEPAEPKPGAKRAEVQPGKRAKLSTDPSEYPSDEEIRKNWHRFRGPEGSGVSAYDNIPTSWDGESGEGILWKTPVPLPGKNSPVVWNDRVFLSGADEKRRQVYCFDAASGKLLWGKDVPSTLSEPLEEDDLDEYSGYAAPTTTTDGKHVFAIFANGDLGAFDFAGELLWSKSLGIPDNGYGHASSLEMYRNLLLVQFDQATAEKGMSKLLALDARTGAVAYEVPRPVAASWTSPCVITLKGGVQLITCADPLVIAYDPADGSEIWRADCITGEAGPSPVEIDGVVHVGNEYCVWSAIRADGKGDVTESHVLWTAEDGLPDTCSPLVTSDYLFLCAYYLYCYDVKTGELLWDTYDNEEAQFETSFVSSPSWVAGRVYLFEEDGKGWILEPTRETAKVIAQNQLGEKCVTSPAFQDGRMYLRGKEHLFCIGR